MPRCAVISSRYLLLLGVLCVLPLFAPALASALPMCLNSGDANNNGQVTPADAGLALGHFLGTETLAVCGDTVITPADVLCTMEIFLGRPACLDAIMLMAQECDCEGSAGDVVELPVRATRTPASTGIIGPMQLAGPPVTGVLVTFRIELGDGVFVDCDTGMVLDPPDMVTVITDDNGLAVACYRLGIVRRNRVRADAPGAQAPAFFEITGFVSMESIAVADNVPLIDDGQLLVVDSRLQALLQVDPMTGKDTPLSVALGNIGAGDPLAMPKDVTIDHTNGTIYVVDFDWHRVVRVNVQRDPLSGNPVGDRTTVSACGERGMGPCLDFPLDIAVDTDGTLLVSNQANHILRVDPETGHRTFVSAPGIRGTGPAFEALEDIALAADGSLVGVDSVLRAVVRVDLTTGGRSIVRRLPICVALVSTPCAGRLLSLTVENNGSLIIASDRTLLRLPFNPGLGTFADTFQELHRRNVFFPTGIAVERSGALVMSDDFFQAVTRFAPPTVEGTFSIVSQPASIGSGLPFFSDIRALAVGRHGDLFVLDSFIFAQQTALTFLVQVDPASGTRTTVAIERGFASALAVEAANTVVVGLAVGVSADEGERFTAATGVLVRLDPAAQGLLQSETFSGCSGVMTEGFCIGDTFGEGPFFGVPLALAIDGAGNILVADHQGRIMRVDAVTGSRTLIAGSGPQLLNPTAMAVDADGNLLVVDNRLAAVIRVDGDGNRTVVSGCGERLEEECVEKLQGLGTPFVSPQGLAIDKAGALLVSDSGLQAVLQVDMTTGNRTILSGCREFIQEVCVGRLQGTGEPFVSPAGLALEPMGALVVADQALRAVWRLQADGNERTIISRGLFGLGPHLATPGDQLSSEAERGIELLVAALHLEGAPLTFRADNLPPGLAIEAITDLNLGVIQSIARIHGTVAGDAVATCPEPGPVATECLYQVTVTVDDGTLSDQVTFTWTVVTVDNRAPRLLNPGDQASSEGETVRVRIVATALDSDPLTFTATGLPSALEIDPDTGIISGTIAVGAAGRSPYRVTITVVEGANRTSVTFTWAVVPDDHSDACADATVLPLTELTGTATGSLSVAGDVDAFSFVLPGDRTMLVTTTGTTDTAGTLRNANGGVIASNDDTRINDLNFLIVRNLTAGTYCVEVRGATARVTGAYTLRVRPVVSDDLGDFPATAPLVAVPSSTPGVLESANEVDVFRFEITESSLIRVTTTGSTDTLGALLATDGNILDFNDDASFPDNLNFALARLLPAGTYFVAVGGRSELAIGAYTLEVTVINDDHGNMPGMATRVGVPSVTPGNLEISGDRDVFRFQVLLPGGNVTVSTLGDIDTLGRLVDQNGVLDVRNDDASFPDDLNFFIDAGFLAAGTYFVEVAGFADRTTGQYTLQVLQVVDDTDDHGDSVDMATPIGLPSTTPGVLEVDADLDVFRFGLAADNFVTIETTGSTNTVGTLLDASGSPIAVNDDVNSPTNRNFRLIEYLSAGAYFVQVGGIDNPATSAYALDVIPGVAADHGGTRDTATGVRLNAPAPGELEVTGDVDVFRFQLPVASEVTIRTTGSSNTSGRLFDADGTLLGFSEDASLQDRNFRIVESLVAGTYFIEIRGGLLGLATGPYTLIVE